MGEYADEQIEREMRRMFGINYIENDTPTKSKSVKVECAKCGRKFSDAKALANHTSEYHERNGVKPKEPT